MNKFGMIRFVKAKLIEQGEPSAFEGSCLYRGTDGKKCAAGHLIKDEFYNEDLEGANCKIDPVREALLKSGVKATNIELVRQMQVIHDRWVVRGLETEVSFADYIEKEFSELELVYGKT